MERAKVLLISLLVLAISSTWLRGQETRVTEAGEHCIPFQAHDGLIYIKAQVNGRPATLIVDTGSVLTMFNLQLVPSLNSESRITITMARGSMLASRLPVGIALGDAARQGRRSFRLNVVVADGVLGFDILSSFKSVKFDFRKSMLELDDK